MTVKASLPFGPSSDGAGARPFAAPIDRLAELARAAAAGDEPALHRLLRHIAPDVLRVARVVLGPSYPDLEYLVEECLLDVVHAVDEFQCETSVLRFALTISFRRVLLTRRSQAERTRAVGGLDTLQGPRARRRSPPASNPSVERRRALVADLLATIPEAQAEAIGLRLVVGLSIQEIARATDVSSNTVRSLLRLGKEALRKALEQAPALCDFSGPLQ
jgi:RNA polymerase sigma-70 factor, ECF subfamily